MKTLFKISIWTYFYAVLLIMMGYINYLIILICIFSLHELGHIIVIKLFHYKINSICLYPCGGIIKTNIQINIPRLQLFIISIAGILMQIILFIVTKNISGYNWDIFRRLNLLIILFNILPIYPLDGYKILLSLIEGIAKYRIIIKVSFFISLISLSIFFIYTHNIIMFIFLYMINMLYIKNYHYYYNKFLLERYLYDYEYFKNYYVSSLKDLKITNKNYIMTDDGYVEEKEVLKRFFEYFH